jgi:hypothetical protein
MLVADRAEVLACLVAELGPNHAVQLAAGRSLAEVVPLAASLSVVVAQLHLGGRLGAGLVLGDRLRSAAPACRRVLIGDCFDAVEPWLYLADRALLWPWPPGQLVQELGSLLKSVPLYS